jgi:hypothetical protein
MSIVVNQFAPSKTTNYIKPKYDTFSYESTNAIDIKMGFEKWDEPTDRMGWLINWQPVSERNQIKRIC